MKGDKKDKNFLIEPSHRVFALSDVVAPPVFFFFFSFFLTQSNCIDYVQAVREELAAGEDVQYNNHLTVGWFNMVDGLSEESSKGYVLWSSGGGDWQVALGLNVASQ